MEQINFAVVIPLYNKKLYVARALDSVVAQSLQPSQIIVVDDGSSDGSSKIVRNMFPTVKYIIQENAGAGAARNRGIEIADEKWIAFLDADDVWDRDHLISLSEVIRTCPAASFISTRHRTYKVSEALPALEKSGNCGYSSYWRVAGRKPGAICSSTTAATKEALLDVGGFPLWSAGEDLACWSKLSLKYEIALHSRETAWYTRGNGGTTEASSPFYRNRSLDTEHPCTDIAQRRGIHFQIVQNAVHDGHVERKDLIKFLDFLTVLEIKKALKYSELGHARACLKDLHNGVGHWLNLWCMLARTPRLVVTPILKVALRLQGKTVPASQQPRLLDRKSN